jgi:hypothetical protein
MTVPRPSRKKRKTDPTPSRAPVGRLPKNALAKLSVGLSFAENDAALRDEYVYVQTPAISAAINPASGKFFFVGRRGTGKTALRTYCERELRHSRVVVPEIFSPSSEIFDLELLASTRRGPFQSLLSAMKRTLIDELLILWAEANSRADLPDGLKTEMGEQCHEYFDERTLKYIADVARTVRYGDDVAIAALNRPTKTLTDLCKLIDGRDHEYLLLIDSIDDFWDGSDLALIFLTAVIHACLEVSTQIPWARALLLLRENIFDRVRALDAESSRVETSLMGLDWTDSQLLELVERRLNRSLITKFSLGGPTWDAFFEQPDKTRAEIFEYCHRRPRDILIYVSHAIDMANERHHQNIQLEDVDAARRRFSDNRFKDLGDEYAENYPNISCVLSRFYGLGRRYTPGGIESLIRKLLNDNQVILLCGSWLYEHSTLVLFTRLLYNIGFVGLQKPGAEPQFRALGPQETSPPAISDEDEVVVHKCYWDALDLRDVLIRELPEDRAFGDIGVLYDLPGGLDPVGYQDRLEVLGQRLGSIPLGEPGAADFEAAVGEVIKLCFFRALENVEHRVRDDEGVVIRDWVASNRAQTGFWAVMRQRYDATQVIWECKNYTGLKASDFHQVSYYSGNVAGRLLVVAFRGDFQSSYCRHIKRIANANDAMVVPLGIRDLKAFVRQNRKGKISDGLIQDRYDQIVRQIS